MSTGQTQDDELNRVELERAYQRADGNITETAAQFENISQSVVYDRLVEYGIHEREEKLATRLADPSVTDLDDLRSDRS